MSVSSLEKVLRYACSNGYTCTQWADPVKQCLQLSEQDLSQDLCDLLLRHFFSTSRVYNILLGSYLTYTLTGESPSSSTTTTTTAQCASINESKSLVDGKQFLSQLTTKDLRFAFNREYNNHWTYMLRLLSSILSGVDNDYKENLSWAPILSKLLVILSHIVAIGLYPQRHQDEQDDGMNVSDSDDMMKQQTPEGGLTASQQTLEDELTPSQQLSLSFTNSTNPLATDSQMTIDPDANFDADATQPDPFTEQQDLKRDINTDNYSDVLLQETTNTAGDILDNSQQLGLFHQNFTHQHQHPSQSSLLYPNSWGESTSFSRPTEKNSVELDNAISAAKIIIDLIEKKGMRRMIENFAQERKQGNIEENQALTLDPEDPWVTCHEILVPDNQKTTTTTTTTTTMIPSPAEKSTSSTGTLNNIYIQKLLRLIERLTDRDLERRLAVHMKYHELEDEGTARAMPSADLMGLSYHMVQICPGLDDDEIVSRLVKLQEMKGSFDESFYLEIWFAALTGLREASLSTNCQNMTPKNTTDKRNLDFGHLNSCDTTAATNRLLWKNLVLVKLPHLISRFQERKEKEKLSRYSLKRSQGWKSIQEDEVNAVESSLVELKTFTDLLNACSPPACCSKFYVSSSKSTNFGNQFGLNGINDDDDDDDDGMMDMINNTSYGESKDLNSPAFIKTIRTISTDDIFTSIVRSCQSYHFLRNNKVAMLLDIKPTLKKHLSYASSFGDLDDAMMNADTLDQQSDSSGKPDILAQIDQNIEQRINSIQSNISQASISELINIGLVSLVHWRKIVDFLLKLLSEKALSGDIRGLSRLCGALCDCPPAINLILQLYPPSDLLGPLEPVCNEWNPSDDYMDVDDGTSSNNDNDIDDDDDDDMDGIQNWYFKFGKIWTFVLIVANKFGIKRIINRIFKIQNGLCYQFFVTGPIIYGVNASDEKVEDMIGRWLFAMGGDGISDDLLRTTNIQLLIRATPSIIDRLLCIYDMGKMKLETFTGVFSYFRRRFLQFLLVPGVTQMLCNELLTENASTALTCMSHLFLNQSLPNTLLGLCANSIVGSLRTWAERQRQYKTLGSGEITQQQQQQQIETDNDQAITIEKSFITKFDLDDEQHYTFSESNSTGVTRRTLPEKTREMFRCVVKSGRSMYMNDMDVDAQKLWEPTSNSKMPKQVVSHYLDLIMFQDALYMTGIHWFIGMIVDEVLEAGKSGGAVRAAELGSCLLTTPLTYNCHGGDTCLSMLQCLLQDVIPSSIGECASKNASFFQGQTLGVFVSDCLLLMYHETNDKVDQLGCQFFEALVIDRVRDDEALSLQKVPQVSDGGSKFCLWNEEVVGSAVWRGFVKGLMRNPCIKEMWPNAYAS